MPDHEFFGPDDLCSWCDERADRDDLVEAYGAWWHEECLAKHRRIWGKASTPTRCKDGGVRPRKKAPPRLAALALVAALQAGCGGPDPYSWDDITCAHELPTDPHIAYIEAIDGIYDLGGTVEFRGASEDGLGGKTLTHLVRPCTVLLFAGWDDTPFRMAAVPWHELVHCREPWRGDRYAREIPAIRQEMQVGRAIGTDEADLHDRAARFLDHHGWLTAENMDVVLDHCPGAATPEER